MKKLDALQQACCAVAFGDYRDSVADPETE